MTTFNTPGPISATVDIILGDIRFVAADRADTVVEVDPVDPSRKLDIEAAEQVDVEFADGRLRVSHPKLRTAFTRKYGSVRVVVELPTGSDVRGDTTQGENLVQGVVGSCRLRNTIGDIRVAQAAEVRLKTSGGKVNVDHVTGDAEVRGNGDVRIGRVDGGTTVKNTAGDVRVGEIGGGTVDLYAAIGGLEVGVPQGTAVRLDARTPTGRVHDHLEAPEQPDRTVTVRARCNGGDITVHRVRAGRGQPEARTSG